MAAQSRPNGPAPVPDNRGEFVDEFRDRVFDFLDARPDLHAIEDAEELAFAMMDADVGFERANIEVLANYTAHWLNEQRRKSE